MNSVLDFAKADLVAIASTQDTADETAGPVTPDPNAQTTALLQARPASAKRRHHHANPQRRRFGQRLGHRMPNVRQTLRGKK